MSVIRLWSDLHLEFRHYVFNHIHIPHEDDKDTILLLAGDIGIGTASIPFIEEMCKHFKYVLMVAGNHEYYSNDFEKVNADFQSYELNTAPKNFHFLYNDSRIIDGVRFLGGTMWTDFGKGDILTMQSARRMMADYTEIYCQGSPITPHFILREHDRFMDFLIAKFDEPFDGKTVVMTHHNPGNSVRRSTRSADRLDACYFADLEQMIGNYNVADLWVCGHCHQNFDYLINETRVVCNPDGYYDLEVNKDFDRNLIIEL
jgi:predicted phosphohydrolase